jgi:hypothetical protein
LLYLSGSQGLLVLHPDVLLSGEQVDRTLLLLLTLHLRCLWFLPSAAAAACWPIGCTTTCCCLTD